MHTGPGIAISERARIPESTSEAIPVDLIDTDRDQNVIPTSSGIDRSMGYLLVGLTVIGFFFVTLFGMTRVEHITKPPTTEVNRTEDAAPTSEIVGAGQ